MSFEVMAWAVKQTAGSGTDKAVLLALANRTSSDTGLCCPKVDTIARDTELGTATVKRALQRLVEKGLVTRERQRRADGSMGVYEYAFPSFGTERASQGSERSVGQGSERSRVSRSLEPQPGKSLAALGTQEQARSQLGKVDRRPVTMDEHRLALDILRSWNEQAGQRLTFKAWGPKLVMRIREHPELTLAEHEHVIAANLADPWWSGPASPSVLYGSAAQFERSVLVAKAGPKETDAQRVLRVAREQQARGEQHGTG